MKLSLMSYTFSRQNWMKNGQFDLAGMCRVGQELKLDGVDMVTTHKLDPKISRQVLADHGLKTVCYTFFPALNKPSAAERAAGVDAVKAGLDTALVLGTDKVMIVTPGHASMPRDITRRYWIRGLQESAGLARAVGITLTIENFPGLHSPFAISSDILEAIREVPELKLTFDNGNAQIGGEAPAISFLRCREHVVHAHFKDWHRSDDPQANEGLDGIRYRPGLIGQGVVEQRACLQAMKQSGYTGHINIEYEGSELPPDEATRQAVKYLHGLMSELN